jgi:ATP-dependent helicase/nuclease subunit B
MTNPAPPAAPAPSEPVRHFLGWEAPALPLAAAWLVALGEGEGRVDLSRVRVVLPGGRAGRRLLELLVEEAGDRHLLPPDLVTVGSLPERLYRPDLPPPRPEVEAAAWRTALAALPAEELAHLLPVLPDASDTTGWNALASTVGALHLQVASEGHTFEEVAARCRGDLLFNDERRWQVLARAQRGARALLDRAGLRDREAARLDALAEGLPEPAPGDPHTLVLVGMVELPGVVRRFLRGWPGALHALVHAPEALASRFDALGAVDPDGWEGATLRIPEENLRVVTRPDDQGRVVLDHLRGLGGERAAEEISVGVPDASVAPLLGAFLEEAGVPARDAGGRPMPRTAPFLHVEAVAEYLDGRRLDALAALVRHPDLAAALGGLEGLPGTLDTFQSEHLQAVLEARLPDGAAAGMMQLQRALGALLGDLAGGEGVGPDRGRVARLAEWAGPLRDFLKRLHPDRTLDRHDPADRDLLAFVRAAAQVLEGFEALPPFLDTRPVPAHRALALLLSALRGGVVPPPADDGAVELLGWLELHLDDAPVLVVTGVNEPFLPASVTDDPFLPHALRSRLGLPDNRRRRARDLYLLSAILASRPSTLLVAGKRDPAGNPLRPSRLLLADHPEAVAARLLRLLEGEDLPAAGGEPLPVGEPFVLPPEPVIVDPGGPPPRVSVTTFRALLADPYHYALERVLGLERVTDEARELDPLHFGNLAHRVLEGWARSEGASSMTERQIADALDAHLDRAFRAQYGPRPLPALRIQREQLRARLHRYAALQAERNQEGWVVAAVEAKPAGEGVAFEVDGVPILLRGRIDRVDHHPASGRWQLLDIKTSEKARAPDAVHRKGREKQWVDLQLPLYRHLARALRRAGSEAPLLPPDVRLETGYILLPGSADEVQIALADWTPDELEGADRAAEEAVRTLRANRFTWNPEAWAAWPGDPLSRVVGRGVLQDAEETDVD